MTEESKNIQQNVPGLEFIKRLKPVTYYLDIHQQNAMMYGPEKPDTIDWSGKYDLEKVLMSGFIAQEVEEAANEVNYDFNGVSKPKSENDLYGVQYASFVVPLVKAVQEQQEMIKNLEKQNEALKTQNEELKTNNHFINARLEKIELLFSAASFKK
ncbi:MAG: tail fiber domain-containing protein [Saprospiraceae bacterium]|nr:tail fiber domain-containing protein [Saprospiraceae bacterium]